MYNILTELNSNPHNDKLCFLNVFSKNDYYFTKYEISRNVILTFVITYFGKKLIVFSYIIS